MKPIDFPEKYENLMRVAQQALANQQYQQAKELFQRAYELKESFEANSLLVFCLYELDEKKEALKQALLHEKQYLQNEEFAEFYFDLLISAQDFLYARKLIASTDFYESFEQRIIEKIQFAGSTDSETTLVPISMLLILNFFASLIVAIFAA